VFLILRKDKNHMLSEFGFVLCKKMANFVIKKAANQEPLAGQSPKFLRFLFGPDGRNHEQNERNLHPRIYFISSNDLFDTVALYPSI
jgi:hypothetical protein